MHEHCRISIQRNVQLDCSALPVMNGWVDSDPVTLPYLLAGAFSHLPSLKLMWHCSRQTQLQS
jgi:hypothetical protein